MDDIVRLGESSQWQAERISEGTVDCDLVPNYLDDQHPVSGQAAIARGGSDGGRGSAYARSSSAPSRSGVAPPHKVRGPNWTEAEMLVLIGQKRIEWDVRHNCN